MNEAAARAIEVRIMDARAKTRLWWIMIYVFAALLVAGLVWEMFIGPPFDDAGGRMLFIALMFYTMGFFTLSHARQKDLEALRQLVYE